jgi:hypothetical protein
MSTQDNGGLAFPVAEDHQVADNLPWTCGMSLRDWFAGQASGSAVEPFIQNYLDLAAINEPDSWGGIKPAYSEWHMKRLASIEARYRYVLADAMLKARGAKREEA